MDRRTKTKLAEMSVRTRILNLVVDVFKAEAVVLHLPVAGDLEGLVERENLGGMNSRDVNKLGSMSKDTIIVTIVIGEMLRERNKRVQVRGVKKGT